jgi:hypothetical protein
MKTQIVALPQFMIGSLIYLIHYTLRVFLPIYNSTLIRFYLGDILALIVCIPIFVNSQIWFKVRKCNYIMIWDIIGYFLLFSMYCEIVMPHFIKTMTSDPFDILAYAIGGLILYFSQGTTNKLNNVHGKNKVKVVA